MDGELSNPRHPLDQQEPGRFDVPDALLARILDNSPVAIVVHDVEGRIRYVNPWFLTLYGYTRDEVLGSDHSRLFPQEARGAERARLYAEIARTGFWRGEDQRQRKDGARFPSSTSITELRDGAGRAVAWSDVSRDVSGRKRMEEELTRLATTDSLTGAANRRVFMDSGAEEAYRARRYNRPLSVLMLDLDHFKRVNDRFGHPTGDEVLVAVTQACRQELRASDLFARLGGEEFAVLMPETELRVARDVGARLLERVEALEVPAEGGPVRVTVSVGVACLRPGDDGVEEVLKRADKALYAAKDAGRNRVVVS
jgi:diguanylate cyclase (GGDEF)-like protein/PAS domain S-box-containing protein